MTKNSKRFVVLTIVLGILTVIAAMACLFYIDVNRYVSSTYNSRVLIPYYLAVFPILKMGLSYLFTAAFLWKAPVWLHTGTRRKLVLAAVLFLIAHTLLGIIYVSSYSIDIPVLYEAVQILLVTKGELFYLVGGLLCFGMKES